MLVQVTPSATRLIQIEGVSSTGPTHMGSGIGSGVGAGTTVCSNEAIRANEMGRILKACLVNRRRPRKW